MTEVSVTELAARVREVMEELLKEAVIPPNEQRLMLAQIVERYSFMLGTLESLVAEES